MTPVDTTVCTPAVPARGRSVRAMRLESGCMGPRRRSPPVAGLYTLLIGTFGAEQKAALGWRSQPRSWGSVVDSFRLHGYVSQGLTVFYCRRGLVAYLWYGQAF